MNRRTFSKGVLGTIGAAVGGFTLMRKDAQAASTGWSIAVCIDGQGRWVPRAAFPFYVSRYGAVETELDSAGRPDCPVCDATAGNQDCGGYCAPVC